MRMRPQPKMRTLVLVACLLLVSQSNAANPWGGAFAPVLVSLNNITLDVPPPFPGQIASNASIVLGSGVTLTADNPTETPLDFALSQDILDLETSLASLVASSSVLASLTSSTTLTPGRYRLSNSHISGTITLQGNNNASEFFFIANHPGDGISMFFDTATIVLSGVEPSQVIWYGSWIDVQECSTLAGRFFQYGTGLDERLIVASDTAYVNGSAFVSLGPLSVRQGTTCVVPIASSSSSTAQALDASESSRVAVWIPIVAALGGAALLGLLLCVGYCQHKKRKRALEDLQMHNADVYKANADALEKISKRPVDPLHSFA